VKIDFKKEGGIAFFPGLSRAETLEDDRLDRAEAAEIKRLAEAARFFELPATVGEPAPGAADYQYVTLSIEDGARRHQVRVLIPPQDPALGELLKKVHQLVKAARGF
jgi:hypothetical protein